MTRLNLAKWKVLPWRLLNTKSEIDVATEAIAKLEVQEIRKWSIL